MNALSQGLLTFGIAAALSTGAWGQATTVVTPPAAGEDNVVGLSSRDGITVSDVGTMITRNGVTEKLTKELSFNNGVKILPDGTMIGNDGSRVLLRPGQLLTLDGKVVMPTSPASGTRTGGATGGTGGAGGGGGGAGGGGGTR
jgi:hypothetical protein